MNSFQKVFYVIKKGGVRGVWKKLVHGSSGIKLPVDVAKIDVLEAYSFVHKDFDINYVKKKGKKKLINWYLNDMGASGGGDINIFRFINKFAKYGYRNNVYITYGSRFETDEDLTKFVIDNFGQVSAAFHISTGVIEESEYSFATEWRTAYFLNQIKKTKHKLYFVQDFEPYFFARGSEYYFAENTYKMGFTAITAGHWLKEKLEKDYSMKTKAYRFASNREVFFNIEGIECKKNKIFFYARPATTRRCFETGLIAMKVLTEMRPEVEVVLAGWDLSSWKIDFPHTDLGIMPLDKLNDELNTCNLGLILSATNVSLMPADLMLTGCIPVVNRGSNNSWLVKDGVNSLVVDNDPIRIAKDISELLDNDKLQEKLREGGKNYISMIKMDEEFQSVLQFIENL